MGSGTTPSSKVERYYDSEDYLWVNSGDFNDNEVYGSKQMISETAILESSALRFYSPNTVLVAMYGASIGKVGMLKVKATVNQACCAIVPNPKLVLPYILFYLFISYKNALISKSFGGTQPNVSQGVIANMTFRIPSLSKQQRIVEYLDTKTKKIDERTELLEKKRELQVRLKKAIINQTVTRGLDKNVKLKDSGVEWIGMIPEHWEVKRIKELCSFVSRGATPDYVDDGEYKVMNQAVFSTGNLNHKVVRYSSYMKADSQIKKGDLLIASTGGGVLGKLYFFDDEDTDFYADTHVTIIRNDNSSFYVKFLYYLLSYQFDMINACMAKGSTNQTELQRDSLLSYELAVPPIEEQQAIAAYLDEKSAKIDAAIAIIDKQIDALMRLKRALINEVITGQRAI